MAKTDNKAANRGASLGADFYFNLKKELNKATFFFIPKFQSLLLKN
jgi:hypothetical protein